MYRVFHNSNWSCAIAGGGVTGSNRYLNTNNSGISYTRAAVTDTHTAGYIPAKSATNVIAADTKYLKSVTIPESKALTVTKNQGTLNITEASTGLVNYEDWAIQYNSTNKAIEFVFND